MAVCGRATRDGCRADAESPRRRTAIHPPLRDEDILVELRTTRVAGLEPRRSAEILVAVIRARTFRERAPRGCFDYFV